MINELCKFRPVYRHDSKMTSTQSTLNLKIFHQVRSHRNEIVLMSDFEDGARRLAFAAGCCLSTVYSFHHFPCHVRMCAAKTFGIWHGESRIEVCASLQPCLSNAEATFHPGARTGVATETGGRQRDRDRDREEKVDGKVTRRSSEPSLSMSIVFGFFPSRSQILLACSFITSVSRRPST